MKAQTRLSPAAAAPEPRQKRQQEHFRMKKSSTGRALKGMTGGLRLLLKKFTEPPLQNHREGELERVGDQVGQHAHAERG